MIVALAQGSLPMLICWRCSHSLPADRSCTSSMMACTCWHPAGDTAAVASGRHLVTSSCLRPDERTAIRLKDASLQAATKCMFELVRLYMMQSALTQSLLVQSVSSHGMLPMQAKQALTEGPFSPVASLTRQVPNQCLARGLPDALAHPATALPPSQRCTASRGRV